jgi:peptidoglycan/xylan/chitin deacetylase (PgdA/CDA1 family)
MSIIKDTYKILLGETEYLFGRMTQRKNDILVLALHSTPSSKNTQFEELVEWLIQNYKPLSPKALSEASDIDLNNGPYFIMTFDDGLRNNIASARFLASKAIQALYFIVPEFVEADDGEAFYIKNIRPNPDRKIDNSKEDVTPMSWEDIQELLSLGHHIGSHTMSHTLDKSYNSEQLEHEILRSKKVLEEKLNISVEHFASPNNTLMSVSKECAEIIKKTYKFHHTTIPGVFDKSQLNRGIIYRRNVECHWPSGKIKYSLGYFDLPRWQGPRDELSLLVP